MKSTVGQLMFFVGVLLVLMGTYGFLRIVHVSARHVPYPSAGVFPSNILIPGTITSWGHESDCDVSGQLYYKEYDRTTRQPTEEEKGLQDDQSKRCVNGFNEARAKQKQYDVNQSAFLVFVGTGLLFARRFHEKV